MFLNFLLGTGILWGLTLLLVVPLADYLLGRRLARPDCAHLRGEELGDEEKQALQAMATKYYVLADVLVLGAAGFVGGLLGYSLIGVALDDRNWPGMIALVTSSLLGLAVRGDLS